MSSCGHKATQIPRAVWEEVQFPRHGNGGEEEWPTSEAIGRDPEITVVLGSNSAGYISIMLAEWR